MGLKGELEDLGIPEILQMVSLSKKTGILSLQSVHGKGAIGFLEGQVVRAVSDRGHENLGQLLLSRGLIDQDQLRKALDFQRSLAEHRPLGPLLVELWKVPREQIEAAVQGQIEATVFDLLSWREGTFHFQLKPQRLFRSSLNPLDFMLEKGLCPQWLVVKDRQNLGEGLDECQVRQRAEQLERRVEKKDFCLLKGMLAELESPFSGGDIILLILRYASEIMTRGVMFDVRRRQLVGLGQFGLKGASHLSDAMVRRLRLNAEPGSLFARALEERRAQVAPLGSSRAERTLLEIMGCAGQEVFVGPVISEGRVVALFYGDNGPQGGAIEFAPSFEVFLSRAGIAMEQALDPQAPDVDSNGEGQSGHCLEEEQ